MSLVSDSTPQEARHAAQHNTSEAVQAAHESRLDSVEKRVTKVETSKAGPKGDDGKKGDPGKDGAAGTAGTDGVDGRDGFPRPSGGKDGDAIVKDGEGTKWQTITGFGNGTDNEAVHRIHKFKPDDDFSDNDFVKVGKRWYIANKDVKGAPSGDGAVSGTPGPASVTVSGSDGQVNVDWAPVADATSYNVYDKTDALLGTVTSPGYVDIRPTAKKADDYAVSAVVADAETLRTSSDGGDGSAWELVSDLGAAGSPVDEARLLPETAAEGQLAGYVNGHWGAVDAPAVGGGSDGGGAGAIPVPWSAPGTYFPSEPQLDGSSAGTGSGYPGRQTATPVYVAEDTPIDRIGVVMRGYSGARYVIGLRVANADHTVGGIIWTAGSVSPTNQSTSFYEVTVDLVIPSGWSFCSIENAPGSNQTGLGYSGDARSLFMTQNGSDGTFTQGSAGAASWFTYDFAASATSLAAAYVNPMKSTSAPLIWFRRKA